MNEDDDVTTSTSDSGHERPGKRRPSKRLAAEQPSHKSRRTTYYQRKDEIQTLQDEVERLQAKLQEYEARVPPEVALVNDALRLNAVLAHGVQSGHHVLARVQSIASAYRLAMADSSGLVPLQDYIHLPANLAQRNAVLDGMLESKLHSAVQFMTECTKYRNLKVAHKQSEEFELPNGIVCVVALEITPFTSGHSLEQVYDALIYFVENQEMSVSEQLGFLTVRESDEHATRRFRQLRFLSSLPGSVEMETNAVLFSTCLSTTSNSPAYAVVTIDSVDHDDLYPYRPELCVRKELTAAVTLTEVPSTTMREKPAIAMARWSCTRILPPSFVLSEDAQCAARNGMVQWCEVIAKVMKERLSTIPIGDRNC